MVDICAARCMCFQICIGPPLAQRDDGSMASHFHRALRLLSFIFSGSLQHSVHASQCRWF